MKLNELADNAGYAIPVLASKNIQESIDFFVVLGADKTFMTEDDSYGGVSFGGIEFHFYLTQEQHLIEWSICRVNMNSIQEVYEICRDAGVLHPNGDLATKDYGYKEFSILDTFGVCYTFAERVVSP